MRLALHQVTAQGWFAERIERAAVGVENLFTALWWTGAHGWGYEHPARWVRNMILYADYTGTAHPGIREVGEGLLEVFRSGRADVDYAQHGLAVYNHEELLMGLTWYARWSGDSRIVEAARALAGFITEHHPRNAHYYKSLAIGRLLDCDNAFVDLSARTAALAIAEGEGTALLNLSAHGAAAAMIACFHVQLYEETGDARYLGWARDIQQAIYARQMVTGGIGETLHFTESPGESDLHDETCQTAWWLLLNLTLWRATGEMSYLDLAERIFLNHLLFQQLHRGEDAGFTAMNDIDQGCRGEHNYICCDNEGFYALLETLTHVFTIDQAARTLSVNLFLPAEGRVAWADGADTRVTLHTDYPVRGSVRLRVDGAAAAFRLRVRIPGWTRLAGVYLNGMAVDAVAKDGYVALERTWTTGDEVTVVFPLPLRVEVDNSGKGAQAGRVCIDGVEQEAKRVAVFAGPAVAAIFRMGHGNDVSWVWTGDYTEILDTGGCANLGYPASRPDYLLRDGVEAHSGHIAALTEITTGSLPSLRWSQELDGVRMEHTVEVLPGLPVTLRHREEIIGWDGRGVLLCAGLRFALRKNKRNQVYTTRDYSWPYPPAVATTKPNLENIAHEEYGYGTFSRYEPLEDGVELAKTGVLRMSNAYFRAISLYDPEPVEKLVCRATEDWVGVYLQPMPAERIVLTRQLVFPLAARPLCQSEVAVMTERAGQVQATVSPDGATVRLDGPLTYGVPVYLPANSGLHLGQVLANAEYAATVYADGTGVLLAVVSVPGEYRVVG